MADSAAALKNYTFKVGKMPVAAKEIPMREFGNNPIKWSDEKGIEVIGTIGTNLIDGRVILIDYPQKEMTIGPDVPSNLTRGMELDDFVYVNRSVLLPAVIKGKKTILVFDTGSSAYELLTDKKTFASLVIPGITQAQYPVKSWDRVWTAHTAASNDSVEIAFRKLPIKRVTYIEGVSNSQIEQMMKMGIGGMTGNKLFLKNTLLLDTKNRKFGIGKG